MLVLLRGRHMLLLCVRGIGRSSAGGERVRFAVTLPDSAEIYRATDCDPARVILLMVMFATFAAAPPTSTTGTRTAGARATSAAGRFGE